MFENKNKNTTFLKILDFHKISGQRNCFILNAKLLDIDTGNNWKLLKKTTHINVLTKRKRDKIFMDYLTGQSASNGINTKWYKLAQYKSIKIRAFPLLNNRPNWSN